MFEVIADQTSLCTGCPKMCRHVCPVSNTELRETVTPGLKMTAVDLARRGSLPLDESLAQTVGACTGCGGCSQFCLLGNNVAQSLFTARQPLAQAGVSAVARRMEARLAQSGNPSGANLEALQRERVPARAERGSLTLWPGCTALKRLPDHAGDVLRAVETALDQNIAVVPVNPAAACCGYPLWAAGMRDAFTALARRVSAHVKDRGPLVTSDPGCSWTFNVLYPAVGAPLEHPVRHVSEVLASSSQAPRSSAAAPRVLYHDPCYLGRHQGVYEAPRAALARAHGAPPEEFTWRGETAECSGGGGLYPHNAPEMAVAAARRRVAHEVDELAHTGSQRVVTACPTCEVQFGRAGVPVSDLSRAWLRADSPAPRSEGKKPAS